MMTGVQIMVVLIVAIAMIASVVRARVKNAPARDDAETMRLRDEVKQLKERLAVLERITVEKESSLERQIEQLRDR